MFLLTHKEYHKYASRVRKKHRKVPLYYRIHIAPQIQCACAILTYVKPNKFVRGLIDITSIGGEQETSPQYATVIVLTNDQEIYAIHYF